MNGTIAITDEGWYGYLAKHPELTDVNFWTPSSHRAFRAEPFSPFLFKLRAPHNAICGFAYFARYSRLPDWMAWETFQNGNGCDEFEEMRQRIQRIRKGIRYDEASGSDEIGCILLVSPTYFAERDWIPQPRDWHPRTQSPTKYDLTVGEGKRVWDACLALVSSRGVPAVATDVAERYGAPQLVRPRLGQPSFRVAVLEAYDRACAVTGEHSLPALEASHIQPYGDGGLHETRNGLLLRADLHRLFDRGFLTVTPDLKLKVGNSLREKYKNGKTYYPLNGAALRAPATSRDVPDREFLRWHNEHVFSG